MIALATRVPEGRGSTSVLPCRIQVFPSAAQVFKPQRLCRCQAVNCCSVRFRFAGRVSG